MAWKMGAIYYEDASKMVDDAIDSGELETQQKAWVDRAYKASEIFEMLMNRNDCRRVIQIIDREYYEVIMMTCPPVEGEDWEVDGVLIATWTEEDE